MFIDINCDMGEGMPNDEALMPFISSANIACGYHAGNRDIMQYTIELALQHGVSIGAHPGFADKENFGRTPMQLSASMITDLITDQVCTLSLLAQQAGTRLSHVKPHGALYNMSAADPALAQTIALAIQSIDPQLILVGLSNSHSIQVAKDLGMKTASEVFVDRQYQNNGHLVPRSHPLAMIEEANKAIEQALRMIEEGKVMSIDGTDIDIKADTICIHGDGAHAVAFAKQVQQACQQRNISIKPLTW